MKHISILGCTGSIGTQTLDIVREFPDHFQILGLSCGQNIDLIREQIKEFKPKIVCVANESDAMTLGKEHPNIEVMFGPNGLTTIAEESKTDLLVVAIFGVAALKPCYAAISNGTPIALASKEILVSAGELIMPHAKANNVTILPIDSEHAALKQCLAGIDEDMSKVDKLILTASGGPFWDRPVDTFGDITAKDALKHPNWDMGALITIGSATMMNKGFEIIETHHLYGCPYDKIEVVIHPSSIVHSAVEFSDGTMLAQMGLPDMRFPIQYALTYPDKLANPWPKTSLMDVSPLEFFEPDMSKFPLLKLAYDVGTQGGSAPTVLNAANEVCVQAFLDKKIGFMDISTMVHDLVAVQPNQTNLSLEDLILIDKDTRRMGLVLINA